MFDREFLRNQQLIEERIEYEDDFIDMEGIKKSEELDLEFEFDDYYNQIRDEQLIEMYESQIMEYYMEIDDYESQYDPLQESIDSLEKPEPDYGFFDYDYDNCYFEEIPMDAAYSCGELHGYVVESGGFCDYDYPEGPDENLQGLRYDDPYCMEDFEFEIHDACIPDDYYEDECDMEIEYGEYLQDIEEKRMQNLINQKIKEEKDFFQFVEENEVRDEYLLPLDLDDITFC